tara:strand:- start:124 stop:567 length:444 start_codon:yes stop_codon:yes gene_type:complete
MPIQNCKIDPSCKIIYPDLVNLYGCTIGENTQVGPFVEIQKDVKIGRNCKISSHTFICSGVTIGDNCFIGHGVVFINDRNPRAINEKGELASENDWKLEETFVEDNVSIGSSSTIMCGIKIGKNSLIGARTFVLKDIKSGEKFFNKL